MPSRASFAGEDDSAVSAPHRASYVQWTANSREPFDHLPLRIDHGGVATAKDTEFSSVGADSAQLLLSNGFGHLEVGALIRTEESSDCWQRGFLLTAC